MNVTEERNEFAYRLLKVQEELERCDAALEKAEGHGAMLDLVRATLGPLSGLADWESTKMPNILEAIVERVKSG